MTSAPSISVDSAPLTTGMSPLTRGESLRLLAAVLVAVLGTFGLAALVILVVPGARSIGLAILGAALPIGSVLVLYVIHRGLRRAGTGWRALGFVRPTARILHLLWQIPVVVLLLSGAAFAAAHGVPILLPYMLVLGLSLAFLREFHRTLWAPVIMHVLLNSLVTGGVLVAALS